MITGPPGTPYEGGQYHGKLTFPSEYPFKPPRIKMCTPSGRFEINQPICLSMSDFHEELWNPSWSVATIINGLLSFMTGNERTTGSIVTPDSTKRTLAKRSKYFNLYSNVAFKKNFPELCKQNVIDIAEMEHQEQLKEQEQHRQQLNETQKIDKKEKVTTDFNSIKDPEDRIRAKQLQEDKLKATDNRSSSRLVKVLILSVAILVGWLIKVGVPGI